MSVKKNNPITEARGKLRPFHTALMLVFVLLAIFTMGGELVRRRNPAEMLFSSSPPEDATISFSVRNPAGREQDFYSFLGRGHVVLYLWNTGCTACVDEMLKLNSIAATLPRNQVRILTVATDENGGKVRDFFQKYNLQQLDPYTIVGGLGGMQSALKTKSTPRRFLVDAQGNIKGMASEIVPWDDPRVLSTLQQYATVPE
jgi:thiol-disulfide isomerase/thioredoxin